MLDADVLAALVAEHEAGFLGRVVILDRKSLFAAGAYQRERGIDPVLLYELGDPVLRYHAQVGLRVYDAGFAVPLEVGLDAVGFGGVPVAQLTQLALDDCALEYVGVAAVDLRFAATQNRLLDDLADLRGYRQANILLGLKPDDWLGGVRVE